MSSQRQAQFNLLALPAEERQVLLHLIREGPMTAAPLAHALHKDPAALEATLAALVARGVLFVDSDNCLNVALGRTRRRTLPPRLWPALQAVSRLYSAQEIATLRTVVPILQFARARLSQFTDHGPGHVLRVKAFATQLGHVMGLSPSEQHLLRAAALLHDVGNVVDRATHHIISQETVERLAAAGQLPFSRREAELIGLLCRWHRKEYDPNRVDELSGATIRTGLLASILRVADALDSDYRRVDYDEKFKQVLQIFYPEEVPFLEDLDTILGIRICCTPALQLQVFVQEGTEVGQSFHIRALHKDVADTPLPCTIQIMECRSTSSPINSMDRRLSQVDRQLAMVACPFDPHSLVMAAISRKQLLAAGYDVELLSYPDTPDATNWLWQTALAEREPARCKQLVLIGDRYDATVNSALLAQLARWQVGGTEVTLLNRHEANWARLPDLLERSLGTPMNVTLGADWAYFWGNDVDEADLFWGRIAALCTRDPVQSTVGLTATEQAISHGVLNAVYTEITSASQSSNTAIEWTALATPLLDRIAADDREWFVGQAAAFLQDYTTLSAPEKFDRQVTWQAQGKVLRFELAPSTAPHMVFWGLEAAIEQRGRAPIRGICFNTPYAIATWLDRAADGNKAHDAVELLAINHWREEEATPIRLLYPAELGPTPEGNECALRVRLPAAMAQSVVQALVAACNEA